ncbi:MAG: hypothetical protein OEU74_00110 [Gammaproteobacteria bacterium]|nr:hypothetical protein [Gammaproteobacteria bacterium]
MPASKKTICSRRPEATPPPAQIRNHESAVNCHEVNRIIARHAALYSS